MMASLFAQKQRSFKDKFVEAAVVASGDKKAHLDMTYCAVSILSRMLHELYRDFARDDASEKAARTVATVASIIVLAMQRALEPFEVVIDSEQVVTSAVALTLTTVFRKSRDEAERCCQYGINAYNVVLSNYGRNENIKAYFTDIYNMTINYIDTHDPLYLYGNRQILLR